MFCSIIIVVYVTLRPVILSMRREVTFAHALEVASSHSSAGPGEDRTFCTIGTGVVFLLIILD